MQPSVHISRVLPTVAAPLPLQGRRSSPPLAKLYADHQAALAEMVRCDGIRDCAGTVEAKGTAQKACDAAVRRFDTTLRRFERAPVRTLNDVLLKLRYAAVELKGLDPSRVVAELYPAVEKLVAGSCP